nr:alpha/beta hydrolase [Corynebacterium pacaense]
MARTVANLDRSPAVVALDGPFQHDHVYTRGIRLHVAVAGLPEDPLILLIHGSFGGWFDYRDVIAPLAKAGFHVAAVDMRGYGMSDKPPNGYDLRHAAGDINGIIAALGHDRALLVGNDTGGSVAWTTATVYPERVEGVLSVGALHPVDFRRAVRRQPLLFLPDLGRLGLFRLPIPVLKLLRSVVIRASRREVAQNTGPAYQRSGSFAETARLRRKAMSIDHAFTPMIRNNRLLTGTLPAKLQKDTTPAPVWLLKQHTHRWDHLIPYARARSTGTLRVISIPGTKNLPHLENPEEFAAQVAQFGNQLRR